MLVFLFFFKLVLDYVLKLGTNCLNLVDQVHMEADRKAMGQTGMPLDPHFNEKPSYRIGNKVIIS